MLKSVRLKNFKLHEDTQIEAAPITVFIGPNNSGKSSIFQALLLLRQAASRNDRFLCQPTAVYQLRPQEPYQYPPHLIVDLGSFEEIIRPGRNDIHFEFSGVVNASKAVMGTGYASLQAQVRVAQNEIVLHTGSIDYSGNQTTWEFVRGAPTSKAELPVDGVIFSVQPEETFQLTRSAGYRPPSSQLPPETLLQYNETSTWLGSIPTNLLSSIHPVYALRGFEEWGYPTTKFPPASLDLMTLRDRALALTNALASDRRLKSTLSARLEEILHLSIDFTTVPIDRLKIWATRSGNSAGDTLFANEGTGANQLPFILIPVLLTPPNETILLSEPEAHLHPKAQSELTSILLKVAKKENIQFLIETHSEHVLHKLLHAVASGELDKSQLAIHYFQTVDGKAEVQRLEIDDKGAVKGGLPGFFDQSLRELSEYLDTIRKA